MRLPWRWGRRRRRSRWCRRPPPRASADASSRPRPPHQPCSRPMISASVRWRTSCIGGGRSPRRASKPAGSTWQQRLGEKMVVGAVRAVDLIVRAQRADAGDGGALLADRRMSGPVHEVLVDEREHVFLEGADQVQVVQRAHQPGAVRFPPVGGGRSHLPPRRLGMQGVHVGHGGLPRSAAGP